MQKAFVSTIEGQKALCSEGASKAPVTMMNNFVRKHEPESAWSDSAIQSAAPQTLKAIMEDLLPIYNRLASR